MWHASAAFSTPAGPLPFEKLRRKQIKQAAKLCRELLDGVGRDPVLFTTDPPGAAIHLQKPLNENEIALLPNGWMEIPAVDERGPLRRLSP